MLTKLIDSKQWNQNQNQNRKRISFIFFIDGNRKPFTWLEHCALVHQKCMRKFWEHKIGKEKRTQIIRLWCDTIINWIDKKRRLYSSVEWLAISTTAIASRFITLRRQILDIAFIGRRNVSEANGANGWMELTWFYRSQLSSILIRSIIFFWSCLALVSRKWQSLFFPLVTVCRNFQ